MNPVRRLSAALPDGARLVNSTVPVIGVLPGEGIGPEVVAVALDLLQTLGDISGRRCEVRLGGAIGNDALREQGSALPDGIADFCREIFAAGGPLLCGPGGARFVYLLRERFDLFCKFTPLQTFAALEGVGPLRAAASAGVDVVVVRENVGGLYFGEGGLDTTPDGAARAYHRFDYRQATVERILGVALRLAAMRRGRLAVVVKREGVPAISALWLDVVERLAAGHRVEVEILDIDNAVYQLIADAARFDVLVSSNMFGDVLSDCGALLLGSRGLSYSGNFGPAGAAVYQTGHGAAYDIAGRGLANPVGQILSLAMLLQESFGWSEAAALLRDSVASTLAAGFRTRDVAGEGSVIVDAQDFGQRVAEAMRRLGERKPCASLYC